jgi:hypothetical protein
MDCGIEVNDLEKMVYSGSADGNPHAEPLLDSASREKVWSATKSR